MPMAFAVPYGEACQERVWELWEAFDEARDALPSLEAEGRLWQPVLWEARGLAPHRSLAFRPTGPEAPQDVAVVVELCVDREKGFFFPRLTLRSVNEVPMDRCKLDPFASDLRRIASAAVAAFRLFRKYGFVGGSCQDYVLEVGRLLGITPLEALQPQADRITEELSERTRPTVVRVVGLLSARLAATVMGCSPFIAAIDLLATTGAAGQLSRAIYREVRAGHVMEADKPSAEGEEADAGFAADGAGGRCSSVACPGSGNLRARRYVVADAT